MTVTIGRRELLIALGGAAAWPLAARAQQPAKVVRIGLLLARCRGNAGTAHSWRGIVVFTHLARGI